MKSKHTLLEAVRRFLSDLYTFARRIVESDEQAEKIILKTLNQLINQPSLLLKASNVKISLYALLYQNLKKTVNMELEDDERLKMANDNLISLFNCLDQTYKSVSQKVNVLHVVSENEVKNLIHQIPRPFRVCYLLSLLADFDAEKIAVITELSVAEVSGRIIEANQYTQFGLWQLLKEKTILVE